MISYEGGVTRKCFLKVIYIVQILVNHNVLQMNEKPLSKTTECG